MNSKISANKIHIGDINHSNNHIKDKKLKKNKTSSIDTNQVKALISKGNVDEAIEVLLESTNKLNNKTYNQVIHQSGALKEIEKKYSLNMINYAEFNLIKSKITQAILSIVDQMGEL